MSYPTTYLVVIKKDRETNYHGFMELAQAKRFQKKHGGKLIIEKGYKPNEKNKQETSKAVKGIL